MDRVAILGTGLIGASLGIALRGRGHRVDAWDPDPSSRRGAEEVGAVDRMHDRLGDALDGADLVILAGPVQAIVETVAEIETPALVTDVAGVKGPVMSAVRPGLRFVGGHPMAGRETAGPAGASGSLFRGATWVLTPGGGPDADLEAMVELVEGIGAVPRVMDAATHDAVVAAVSHLPQLLASVLVETAATRPDAFDLAAGGFRDLTRVALSDPGWWAEILVANRAEVAAAVAELVAALGSLTELIERGDVAAVAEALGRARKTRGSLRAPVAAVGVVLEDEPGEIARVGHALERSGVDLRDLQLRHATHGGGGVLTLSVRAEELARLRVALETEGFTLLGSAV